MIVDVESGDAGRAVWSPLLMPVAIGLLLVGLAAIVLQPALEPSAVATQRARVEALVPRPPAPTPAPVVLATQGPSVLARSRPSTLAPSLRLPSDLASALSASAAEAAGVDMPEADPGRTAYRLTDGRIVVLAQYVAAAQRPRIAIGNIEEGSVRGVPAQYIRSRAVSHSATITWIESGARFELWSATVGVPELIRLAEQLR